MKLELIKDAKDLLVGEEYLLLAHIFNAGASHIFDEPVLGKYKYTEHDTGHDLNIFEKDGLHVAAEIRYIRRIVCSEKGEPKEEPKIVPEVGKYYLSKSRYDSTLFIGELKNKENNEEFWLYYGEKYRCVVLEEIISELSFSGGICFPIHKLTPQERVEYYEIADDFYKNHDPRDKKDLWEKYKAEILPKHARFSIALSMAIQESIKRDEEGLCEGCYENAPEDDEEESDIESVLKDRQKTHGDFSDHAALCQHLKDKFRSMPGWEKLSFVQRQSLDMIADKISRILVGNPNEPDHWLDIEGYAKLARKSIKTPE